MKTAREIIASAAYASFAGGGSGSGIDDMATSIADGIAGDVVAALEAAGYRIVSREDEAAERAHVDQAYLQEVADGAYGDGPFGRGRARDLLTASLPPPPAKQGG